MEKLLRIRVVGELENCWCWKLAVGAFSLLLQVPFGLPVPTGNTIEDPLVLFSGSILKSGFDHWFALMELAFARKQPVFYKDDIGLHQVNSDGRVITHLVESDREVPPVLR